MKLSEFSYNLPPELIAQQPLSCRDESRLLILNRQEDKISQAVFTDLPQFVNKHDLLVLNDTRVLPARLFARRKTGGRVEVLLLKEKAAGLWEVLVKPGKKARPGEEIIFADGKFYAQVLERTSAGGRLIRFNPPDIKNLINNYGTMPLPHYIKQEIRTPGRYQTIYAKQSGAVAAPTAGLHFTKGLLGQLISGGVKIAYITLHCGLGTFRPVKIADIRQHRMEAEYYRIGPAAAQAINRAKAQGKRIIAVGTTVVRALESAALKSKEGIYQVRAEEKDSQLYIYPGYKFKIIDCLLTNFHLPGSTNLILVSALAGIEPIRQAYQYAMQKGFRFYSFGDAMLVI
jgi:S-adenosylmethionine:tRNA ribosyltransferase-isomerase